MARSRFPHQRLGRPGARSVMVIGLGRFGGSLATELVRSGTEVLGVDVDEDLVQDLSSVLTHAVQADTTSATVLEQLGAAEFDRVVIGIGTNIQASILTASQLLRMGVRSIWAKAISDQHGLILEQLGVEHVIYPEADMGRRVAHLVRGAMLDYVELDPDLVVAKTLAPVAVTDRALGPDGLQQHGVTLVKIKGAGGRWRTPTAETVPRRGDLLVVTGPMEQAEAFCQLH